jgi:hypothetical protein
VCICVELCGTPLCSLLHLVHEQQRSAEPLCDLQCLSFLLSHVLQFSSIPGGHHIKSFIFPRSYQSLHFASISGWPHISVSHLLVPYQSLRFADISDRPFPGVWWPGRGVDHPPPSSAEVKEIVELYLCSSCGLSVCSRVNFLTYVRVSHLLFLRTPSFYLDSRGGSHQFCTFACPYERLHCAGFSSKSVCSYFAIGSENFLPPPPFCPCVHA